MDPLLPGLPPPPTWTKRKGTGTSAPPLTPSEMELVAQQPAFYAAVPLGRRGEPAGSNFPTKVPAFQSFLLFISEFRAREYYIRSKACFSPQL